jgi:EAL domain-containing protein (putative c-di-GMP-specific phosphodiesterase class I)
LKIDNAFIKDLPDNPEHATLVETIIMMGHQLGFTVLAEGVETAKQHDFLLATNCDFAQGFLYSHPIPAEVFEQQYLLKD